MKKSTIMLFVVFLALGAVFYLPATIAKAEDATQTNVNEEQIIDDGGLLDGTQTNTNEEQDDLTNVNKKQIIDDGGLPDNGDQATTNEEQADVNEFNGEKYRSSVSTSVQNLLNAADKEKGGLGEQIRIIAQEQNESVDADVKAIDKIKNRGRIKTFLIGTDYKNIGKLRSGIAKNGNQINKLNNLLDKTTSADTKTALQAQTQILVQEQQKIETFIKANESKFSLFGWFTRLFNK